MEWEKGNRLNGVPFERKTPRAQKRAPGREGFGKREGKETDERTGHVQWPAIGKAAAVFGAADFLGHFAAAV